MSTQQKRDWKQEALQARRSGSENELQERNIAELNIDGVDGEKMEEDVYEEMEEITQAYVEWFKSIKEDYGSSPYALYCLALSSNTIPDPNRIRLSEEEFVFTHLLERKIISPESYTFTVDPSDESTIPRGYNTMVASKMTTLGNALYRLINQGLLNESDFIRLIRMSNSLSPDTEAFLNDGLFDIFEGDYVQSLFVLMPHLEATIVETLRSRGIPAYTITEQGTQQQLLGGLFFEGDDLFGEHYSLYLRYRYTSRQGLNLRNRLAHGQFRYRNANYLTAILTLFDIIKSMIKINISPFLKRFNTPHPTLSPSTNYEKETDLSIYTDLNQQIMGYAESTDGHTILVLRENRHQNVSELFIDRGRINRYSIEEMGLSREEWKDEIEQLREESAEIPKNLDYTWLDRFDLISYIVLDIISGKSCSDPVNKELIVERAKVRGVDESTTRIAFQRLEEDGEIEQTEDTVSLSK